MRQRLFRGKLSTARGEVQPAAVRLISGGGLQSAVAKQLASLPAPTEQTQCAEADSEQRQCGGSGTAGATDHVPLARAARPRRGTRPGPGRGRRRRKSKRVSPWAGRAIHLSVVRDPNRPSCSPFGPAVKYTVSVLPPFPPLPTRRLHNPSMTIAFPRESRILSINSPVVRL